MSVDMRRSTDLMLKCRDPRLFTSFLTHLCDELHGIVVDHYGVWDKFTGDGVLAFFPDFFSGEDAGYYAIKAAHECHAAFQRQYDRHRNCFTSVLEDVGLGVGIDYGTTFLVRQWGGLTVVGTPVVYACRMGDAEAGVTLLNQPAYEIAFDRYVRFCHFDEARLDIKREGVVVAYRTTLNGDAYEPVPPDWPRLIERYTDERR